MSLALTPGELQLESEKLLRARQSDAVKTDADLNEEILRASARSFVDKTVKGVRETLLSRFCYKVTKVLVRLGMASSAETVDSTVNRYAARFQDTLDQQAELIVQEGQGLSLDVELEAITDPLVETVESELSMNPVPAEA